MIFARMKFCLRNFIQLFLLHAILLGIISCGTVHIVDSKTGKVSSYDVGEYLQNAGKSSAGNKSVGNKSVGKTTTSADKINLDEVKQRHTGTTKNFGGDGEPIAIYLESIPTESELLVYSPNGMLLASVGRKGFENGKSLKIWDVDTGRELHTLNGHTSSIRSLSFSADGKFLASSAADLTVKLWDVVSGKELLSRKLKAAVNSLAMSPTGSLIAYVEHETSLHEPSRIMLWNVVSGEITHLANFNSTDKGLAFSTDGGKLAAFGVRKNEGKITVWHVQGGGEVTDLKTGTSDPMWMSGDAKKFFTPSFDKTKNQLTAVDITNKKPGTDFKGLIPLKNWAGRAYYPAGRTVADANKNEIKILELAEGDFNPEKGREKRKITGSGTWGYYYSVSADGKKVVSLTTDNRVNIWDTTTWKIVQTIQADNRTESPSSAKMSPAADAIAARLQTVYLSPAGKYLVTIDGLTNVKLFSTETGQRVKTGNDNLLYFATFAKDDSKVLSLVKNGSDTYQMALWDLPSGQQRRTIGNKSNRTQIAADFSSDGKKLIVTDEEQRPNLYEVETGRKIRSLEDIPQYQFGALPLLKPDRLASIHFTPDGKKVLGGGYHNVLYVWDIESAKIVSKLKQHKNSIVTTTLSRDGSSAVTSGEDNTVILWDLTTGTVKNTFQGHSAKVLGANLTQDGKFVVSVGEDRCAKVWSAESGALLATVFDLSELGSMIFTPEGYFDASNFLAAEKVSIRQGLKVRSASDFWDVFYRPDIVRTQLEGKSIRPLIGTLTIQEALKNPPPSVTIVNAPTSVDQKKVKLTYEIQNNNGGVGEVRVFHNGKLVFSDGHYKDISGSLYTPIGSRTPEAVQNFNLHRGIKKVAVNEGSGNYPTSAEMVPRTAQEKDCNPCRNEVEVEVLAGEENTISVVGFNRDNTIQSSPVSASFSSTLKKEPPTLWLLAVGINKFTDIVALNNAYKDALDFGCVYAGKDAMREMPVKCEKNGVGKSIYGSDNLKVVDVLLDHNAGKEAIMSKLKDLAEKALPQDVFVLFIASHGMLDSSGQYSFAAYDTKCVDSQCTQLQGHITSTDLLEASKKIKAMTQLLILDTCHSGGLDYKLSGLYDARMSVLAKNMGLHLFASAQATDVALDGKPGTNGLFTSKLLEGILGAARKNEKGNISIMTLGDYAKTKTAEQISFKEKNAGGVIQQMPLIQHFGKDYPLAHP